MRSICFVVCICLGVAACGSGGAKHKSANTSEAPAPTKTVAVSPPGPPTRTTALAGAVSPSNPSTAIVDINRSVAQPLSPNSPPPTTFENSCAPAPYLFQSKAGYEAVRVKDCKNDQLLYLPSSAQVQIGIYSEECQRRCGGR